MAAEAARKMFVLQPESFVMISNAPILSTPCIPTRAENACARVALFGGTS